MDAIGQQAVDQLPWGHNIVLMYGVRGQDERSFYICKVIEHGWSRNVLSMQIETRLHEREGKAITNFSDQLPSPQSELALATLRNPYLFDFLSLGKDASAKLKRDWLRISSNFYLPWEKVSHFWADNIALKSKNKIFISICCSIISKSDRLL